MKWKETIQHALKKIKSFWTTGKIQKTSRITYDVSWNIILFFLIIGAIGLFFAGGVGAGYFASLVKDEPVRSYESMEKDIYDYEETSKLYFDDEIYIGDVRSDLHREETSLENISDLIIKATKATEDRNFDEHNGIVPRAIVRAVIQEATNSETKSGGSTLTQQLIKNQILTNEVSFERKAKEILLAMRLENFFEKNQILEAYLNIIPYGREASGGNIAGVQTAAQGIFGVDAENVNLPQAAYLAGLPQSPSTYTPFASRGGLKKEKNLEYGINRMKTVLDRMLDAGYISKEEYNKASSYDIKEDFIEESTSPAEKYPYLTYELQKEARDIIMDQLLEEDGLSRADAENDPAIAEEYEEKADRKLRRDGYNIHSTINKDIFDAQRKVAKNYEHYGPSITVTRTDEDTGEDVKVEEPVQTGAVMMENDTGKIISFVGGREYTEQNQLNYATNAERSPGSTIKPLLDYAPAFEMGAYQPGSPIADTEKEWPENYGSGNYGIVSARQALANSYNVSAVEVYKDILPEDPASYLTKMGISLTEVEHEIEALALGSTDMTVEENVNAFATFGNNGKYTESYMIEKIETNEGEVVYEHETETKNIFSPQTTYLTLDVMRDVIAEGTAASMPDYLEDNSVDWAGKTGTSEDYHDAWFVGVNPEVTFGSWIGYDKPTNLKETCPGCSLSYNNRSNKLWAEYVNAAAEAAPELVATQEEFQRPDGIVEQSYCAISGMKPSSLCEKAGLVKSDLFNEEFIPTKEDDSLISGNYVKVDGKSVPAGEKTPSEFVKGDGLMFNPDFLKREGYDELDDISELYSHFEREKWEEISSPGSEVGNSADIEDDGKSPSAPTSLAHSGDVLSWDSSPDNVVGFRIFRADEPGDSFHIQGSTTNKQYTVENDGVYKVRAVDYFGRESSSSSSITIGHPDNDGSEDDENRKDNDKGDNNENEEQDNSQEKDEQKNKGKNGNNEEESSNNEGNEGNDGEGNNDSGNSDNGNNDEGNGSDEKNENDDGNSGASNSNESRNDSG